MLSVLYEDNHLLVVNKPAGIATMGAESGPTVHSLAADYIRKKYNKPGKVFVGIVSRLDTVTSGVLVLARTSKAASRLTPQFSPDGKDRAAKIYLAIVNGCPKPETGEMVDDVWKDDQARRMRISRSPRSDSQTAKLNYVTVASDQDHSLAAVRLATGRKHQIRVQFAERGMAIIGDRKYGESTRFSDGITLHSYVLGITHPTLKKRMIFSVPPPNSWQRYATLLGDSDRLRSASERLGVDPSEVHP